MVQIEFKPIIPPEIKPQLFKKELLKAMDRELQIDRRMLQKTTTTWKKPRPVFKVEVKVNVREGARGRVWTEDDRWNWTDQGTKAHTIRSKTGKNLKFTVGGRSKTKVRTLGSGGGKRGKRWVSKKSVRHPGTKAREFSQEVIKRRKKFFVRDMRFAVRTARTAQSKGK